MSTKGIKSRIKILKGLQMFLLGGVGGIIIFICIMQLLGISKITGVGIIVLLFLLGFLMIVKLNIILLSLEIKERRIQMFIQEPIQKI